MESKWDIEVERRQEEDGDSEVYHVPDEQYEEMKRRFLEYLEENEKKHPSDIAEVVGVPIQFSLNIVSDLMEEGKIEEVDDGE